MKEISAGGVVFLNQGDDVLLLLIEDRHGKITLAKGKQEPGETLEETAIREILEETGIQAELIALIDTIHYTYLHPVHGEIVHKEVHYYLASALSEEATAQVEEINGVKWCSPEEAWSEQQARGYQNNDQVLRKALSHLGIGVS